MEKETEYSKKQLRMEELQAFVLFLQEGMKAVERTFPQHKSFVEDNRHRQYKEVKYELLSAEHAA